MIDESSGRILRAAVPAETIAMARALLTMQCIRVIDGVRIGGRIVEVEAYPPGDPASHAYGGMRPRCRSMFLAHWHAYVYFTYGMYFCLNIVSESDAAGAGVLLRALEPTEGIAQMQAHRPKSAFRDLCRGPGRLALALGIDRSLDGIDLDVASELFLERATGTATISANERIGISRAQAARLRFFDASSPYVSGSRKKNAVSGGATDRGAETYELS